MTDIHEGVTLGQGASSKEPLVDRALEHLADIVNRLVRREIAAAAALSTACQRLEAIDNVEIAREVEGGHREQIQPLSGLVTHLGGEPATSSNLRSMLDKARVRLREHRGDQGILEALASIEAELGNDYVDAVETVGFTDDERAVLEVGMRRAEQAAQSLRLSAPHD